MNFLIIWGWKDRYCLALLFKLIIFLQLASFFKCSDLFLAWLEVKYFFLFKVLFLICVSGLYKHVHWLKGTVLREKLLNWGLGEMDWTLTIDRTWVLHFPDHLFNCHNIWTVCCLDVKPVWSLSKTVALRRVIVHAVVALSCLLVCGLQQFRGQQHTLLQCTAEANSTCKQAVCLAKDLAKCC